MSSTHHELPVAEGTELIDRLEFLKLMYASRHGDRREGMLLRQSKGWFQVSGMGHEALGVLGVLLRDNDYLFPYYRDRAMVLARGLTSYDLALAYFAKAGSSSGGRQMPGHYSSYEKNIWSVPTPTGANLLPACGVAWSQQLQNESSVVIATIGDAASRQGEFYEAIAFAVERQLPVIFVVEDNRYGISTCTDAFNPFKLGVFADAIGIQHVNGRRVADVEAAGRAAIARARSGGGPSVLVCEIDRLCSHTSSDDHRSYRSTEEISEMQDRDPITLLAAELISEGQLTNEQWEAAKVEIAASVDWDYEQAESAADPHATQLRHELLGEEPRTTAPPLIGGQTMRMVDAVNRTLKAGLAEDSFRVMFGEDIEDPKGGVFKLTEGLSTQFPNRVFNSPLAEATIAGVACGMASVGMRPVFELQFVDFVGPAWNQISQNLATLRWRSNGDWTCPVVFYAPYGAYLPGGSLWHSQSNEAWFMHTPGLRVVIPSTPEDAAGLMWTAMAADDPTIVLLPKHLIRQQVHVDRNIPPVPFGKARIRQSGSDVTLVTWANCVELSMQVAADLSGEVSVEVIDLRSLQPWDRDTVTASLAKTGRLVVVQEDAESCSAGQMFISELTSRDDSFYSLLSAPRLVSRPDVHIGYNPVYEYAALPSVDDVTAAIRSVMDN
ncbi:MAG: thiamine pyrophosphate-dependent enzyme [Planctomycetaceae bacterium]|nr:thiamine pyrophosphate-dependent enzyme [Planctomycetaceae bacterium]